MTDRAGPVVAMLLTCQKCLTETDMLVKRPGQFHAQFCVKCWDSVIK